MPYWVYIEAGDGQTWQSVRAFDTLEKAQLFARKQVGLWQSGYGITRQYKIMYGQNVVEYIPEMSAGT